MSEGCSYHVAREMGIDFMQCILMYSTSQPACYEVFHHGRPIATVTRRDKTHHVCKARAQ